MVLLLEKVRVLSVKCERNALFLKYKLIEKQRLTLGQSQCCVTMVNSSVNTLKSAGSTHTCSHDFIPDFCYTPMRNVSLLLELIGENGEILVLLIFLELFSKTESMQKRVHLRVTESH